MNESSLLESMQPLVDALSGKFGKLPAIMAWIGSSKVVVMPLANWLQAKITEALMDVAKSPEKDDDLLVESVLSNRAYRLFAFMLKWLTSFKLPSMESWQVIKPK
jgi:hypothetical protein